jgi:hypothetical protein
VSVRADTAPPVARRRTGSDTHPVRERLARAPSWLPLTAIVAVAFAVTAIWVRSIHTFGVMPDEISYVKQALEIARTGMLLGPHNFYFDSWNQLLPLITAPVFGALGMVDAFYAVHTLLALVLASTAVPTYLIARSLGLGRLAANLAAALSVAVPWMLLAGVIMTEDVAYPAFAWAILGFLRTMQQPSARRDLLALAGLGLVVFARTQFVFLGPVLVASVLIQDLRMGVEHPRQAGRGAALVAGVRRTLIAHWLLWTVSAVALAGIIAVQLSGSSSSLLGNYVSAARGNLIPHGTVAAGLVQLDTTAVAVGIVPLTLTAVWMFATLLRPRDPGRHAYAVLLILTVPASGLVAGAFAQRFLDGGTTDLYMFELVPLLCVGVVAWVVDKRGSELGVALVGALTLWLLVGDILQDNGGAFSIINPSWNVEHVLIADSATLGRKLGIGHLDPRIVLAILATGFAVGAAVVRRHATAWVALLAVTLPLLACEAIGTGYAMTKVTEELAGTTADHPQQLNWIDRAVGPGADVGLMLSTNGALENTYYTWWQPNLFNKSVQRAFALGGANNFAQGSVGTVTRDLASGRLVGLDGVRYLVMLGTDTRFGFPQRPVNPGGELLIIPTPTDRLLWATRGVLDTGALGWGSHPLVRVFDHAARPVVEDVTLDIRVTGPETGCPCRVAAQSGEAATRVPQVAATATALLRLRTRVTIPPGGHADLPLSLRGAGPGPASVGAQLVSVTVAQA